MKNVSLVCELGLRYKYPQVMDAAEIIAKENHIVVVHGINERGVYDWNKHRGFQIRLDIQNATHAKKIISLFESLWRQKSDVIIAFSPLSLLIAFLVQILRCKKPSHSLLYYSLELEKPSFRKSGRLSCILFLLPLIDCAVLTTGPGRARVLKKWFGLKEIPSVIMNAALLSDASTGHKSIENDCFDNPIDFTLAFAGGLSPLNCLEETILALDLLPARFRLMLIGPIQPDYCDLLNTKYARHFSDFRIIYLGEIEGSRKVLIKALAKFSMGVALKSPSKSNFNINDRLYTPNKAFDYLAAGIPFVTLKNSENYVFEEAKCAVLLEKANICPSSIADAALRVEASYSEYKKSVFKSVIESFNFDRQIMPVVRLLRH